MLDYKSDYAPYLSENDFKKLLYEKYENQLTTYRYAIGSLFDVEESKVGLAVISFDGDEVLELRYTNMD